MHGAQTRQIRIQAPSDMKLSGPFTAQYLSYILVLLLSQGAALRKAEEAGANLKFGSGQEPFIWKAFCH